MIKLSVRAVRKSVHSFTAFRDDVRGAVTAFSVVTFLTMFLAVGMGVDFIRFEANRAELQDALDRGVLAAASSNADTNSELEAVIRGYLRSTNYINDGYTLNVYNNSTFAIRNIQASLAYGTDTIALKLAGIHNLSVGASASAFQGVSDIEISLALDISGSMARERTTMSASMQDHFNDYGFQSKLHHGTGAANANGGAPTRLDVLRVSADQFIDAILSSANSATTTISLIPFSGQVNAGQDVFNAINSSSSHSYSRCFEFTSSDYSTTSLPSNNSRAQVPHFQWFRYEANYGNQAE